MQCLTPLISYQHVSIFKTWLKASTPWPHGCSHTICLFERPPNVGWPCVLLSLSLSWLTLVQGICDNHQVILQEHQVTKSEVWSLLQLTPIGLKIFNNALLAFSFSNTFLSLGKPLIRQNFLIFSKFWFQGALSPHSLLWSGLYPHFQHYSVPLASCLFHNQRRKNLLCKLLGSCPLVITLNMEALSLELLARCCSELRSPFTPSPCPSLPLDTALF